MHCRMHVEFVRKHVVVLHHTDSPAVLALVRLMVWNSQ
jgi:hypothetical protein